MFILFRKNFLSSSLLGIQLAILSTSCEEQKTPDEDTVLEHETEMRMHDISPGDVEILVIDHCEYIIYKEIEGASKATGYMSHKGNCKNPVHAYSEISRKKDSL